MTEIQKHLHNHFNGAFLNLFLQRPMTEWPKWFGDLNRICLPHTITPLSKRTTLCGSHSGILLRLLQSVLCCDGEIAECGVYQGRSIIPMGRFLKERAVHKKVFGFDSFIGFDDSVLYDRELQNVPNDELAVGAFSNTSIVEVADKIRAFDLEEGVQLTQGFFRDTLVEVSDQTFCFVHLDCDLFQSYKECLEFFYPRLSVGGIILLDEYLDPRWPGCTKAVAEFTRSHEIHVLEVEMDNYVKYYLKR